MFFHRDHHVRDNKGFFEKNDFFFLTFLINFRSRLAALWSWALAYIFNNGINELIIKNDDPINE